MHCNVFSFPISRKSRNPQSKHIILVNIIHYPFCFGIPLQTEKARADPYLYGTIFSFVSHAAVTLVLVFQVHTEAVVSTGSRLTFIVFNAAVITTIA